MTSTASDYLRHLPEIFRAPSETTGKSFLGEYLKAFEALLSGRDDAIEPSSSTRVISLEERVDGFVRYLDPALVPLDQEPGAAVLGSEFLNYLASWVALTLDQNWDMAKKRLWLSRIVPLYKRRGTLVGIRAYLAMFVGNQASVDELPGGFVVNATSTIGEDTFLSGAPAYYFRVRIGYGFGSIPFDIEEWKNILHGTRAIVDAEKPAHTYYTLDARTPGFIVAEHSTIASDSLIWEKSQPFS